jgi:hypothetical protein
MLLGEPPLLAILSSFPEKKNNEWSVYNKKLYFGFLNYLDN